MNSQEAKEYFDGYDNLINHVFDKLVRLGLVDKRYEISNLEWDNDSLVVNLEYWSSCGSDYASVRFPPKAFDDEAGWLVDIEREEQATIERKRLADEAEKERKLKEDEVRERTTYLRLKEKYEGDK